MSALGRAKRFGLTLLLLIAGTGCSGGGSTAPTTPSSPTATTGPGPTGSDSPSPGSTELPATQTTATGPALDADAARAVLLAASFGDPPTLAKVEALKADPVMVSAAADALATAPAGAPRWAAVLVLANATGTATPLVPLLKDADVTIRVMAAIGAIGQGERAGFPVLIEALSHDEYMAGFEPPATAWATASLALARHTALVLGPALDADAADRDASTRRWQDWWTKNETSLHFDVATEEWSA